MNKIKTRIEYTIEIDTEEGKEGEPFKSSYFEYDSNGNTICFKSYLPDGSLDSKITTKYENGKISEEINYSSEDEFIDKTIFHRNNNGKLIKVEIFYPDNTSIIKSYLRNDSEKELEINITDDEGEHEGNELLKFDNNENLIEKVTFDYNGNLEEKMVYEYDENNKIINRKELDKKNKIIIQDQFFYDDNLNLIKRYKLNRKNKLLELVKINYDENNNPVEQNFNNEYFIRFEYDNNGNAIKEERENAHGLKEYQGLFIYNEDGLLLEERTPDQIKKFNYEFFK